MKTRFKTPEVCDLVYDGVNMLKIRAINWMLQVVYFSDDLNDFIWMQDIKWKYSDKHRCYIYECPDPVMEPEAKTDYGY